VDISPFNAKVQVTAKGDLKDAVKFLDKMVDVLSNGLGRLDEPIETVRQAKADVKATEIRVIGKRALAERVAARTSHIEVRRQENLEAIAKMALELALPISNSEPVDQDCSTRFFRIAQDVSNPDLREMWARLLASEVAKPGVVSKRTLDVLDVLAAADAKRFAAIVPFCWTSADATFLLHMAGNDRMIFPIPSMDFRKYGIEYYHFMSLKEAGLLNQQEHLVYSFVGPEMFVCQATSFLLSSNSNGAEVPVVNLTEAGHALLRVCDLSRNQAYLDDCVGRFRACGVKLEPLST